MLLLERFTFTEPDGTVWDAPDGSSIDGASIPRALWTLVGSPYTGNYRRASVVHDIACDRAAGDPAARRAADRMFYRACRAGGCSVGDATILYLGVRVGAHLPAVARWRDAAPARGPRARLPEADSQLARDFQEAIAIVRGAGETDDVGEIERRADAALSGVVGMDLRGR
jgi:hypothetical protein